MEAFCGREGYLLSSLKQQIVWSRKVELVRGVGERLEKARSAR